MRRSRSWTSASRRFATQAKHSTSIFDSFLRRRLWRQASNHDGAPPEPQEDPGGTRDAAARAVSAIDRAEKLCRSMHRMSSLTDDYREELSTAVRTAERFTERIETIHSSRVRRRSRRLSLIHI